MTIRERYVSDLQNYAHYLDVQASIWTFRTIRDLRSLAARNNGVLSAAEKAAVLGRGILAILAWLPVNIVAIPHVFAAGAIHRKWGAPHPRSQLDQILPGLFLGTEQAARDAVLLDEHGITAVLTVHDEPVLLPELVTHTLRIDIEDYPHEAINHFFDTAFQFVESRKAEGQNVLVHCSMGMSRSASIVTAIVQKTLNCSPKQALQHVKSRRPVIDPNYGFRRQLERLNVEEGVQTLHPVAI